MTGLEYQHYYDVNALEKGLSSHSPNEENEANHLKNLKQIQEFYLSLKEDQMYQPEVYQPAGEWREHVEQRAQHYHAFFDTTTDRLSSLLSNFWRNELGVLVKQYASYAQLVKDAHLREKYSEQMAHDLMIWRNLFDADFSELEVPVVGNPWGYLWDGTLIGSKVLRYYALMSQIAGLVEDINRPVIAELGAGYCGLAYYLMRGDDRRVYIDFDLPETLAVGAYYLSESLPHRKLYLHSGGPVDWQGVLANFDVIMMPNWAIDSLPAESVDVFVNTFSLSEMTRPVIQQYLGKISTACKHYFLHNNMDRDGVVNEGFERTPASQYPFPEKSFKCLYKRYDLFQQKHFGRSGDYREFLYQKYKL